LSEIAQDGSYALVVGEEGRTRRQVEGTLRAMGWAVAAGRIDEITSLPEAAAPRLILLDSNHLHEQCWREQDQLRRHPGLGSAPLLVLGDESDATSLTLAIGHGASAYLAKPVSADVLTSVISKLVSVGDSSPAVEHRRHPRRPLLMPVDVQVESRDRSAAWIMDASASGCRIETSEAVAAGNTLRVWLPTAEATARQPLTGRTCWSRSLPDGLSLAGMRFTGAGPLLASLALGLEPASAS
jgi:DNA-binding response OmpR family regulator